MSYNKALVTSKQKAFIKSLTELLDALNGVDLEDDGNGNTIVSDDGTVMVLNIENHRDDDGKLIQKISITKTELNQEDTGIRLVKKPEKTIIKLKKL